MLFGFDFVFIFSHTILQLQSNGIKMNKKNKIQKNQCGRTRGHLQMKKLFNK